jgi:hypothetical protein
MSLGNVKLIVIRGAQIQSLLLVDSEKQDSFWMVSGGKGGSVIQPQKPFC